MTLDELIEKALAAKAKHGGLIDVKISQWDDESNFSEARTAEMRNLEVHDDEAGEYGGESLNFCITDEF